ATRPGFLSHALRRPCPRSRIRAYTRNDSGTRVRKPHIAQFQPRTTGGTMNATTRAQAPIAIEGGGVEVRLQEIGGGISAGFVSLPAGADLRPATKGLPDDLCQCPHWGYLLKGRVKMHTKNGAHI